MSVYQFIYKKFFSYYGSVHESDYYDFLIWHLIFNEAIGTLLIGFSTEHVSLVIERILKSEDSRKCLSLARKAVYRRQKPFKDVLRVFTSQIFKGK